MDWLFPFLCHQLPERTPHLAGAAFPLCFRCSGTYLGLFAAYLYLACSGGFKRSLPRIPALIAGSVLMLPFFIDGWANTLHWWDTPGWVRLLTGIGQGVMLPLLLVPIASGNVFPDDWARFKPALPNIGSLVWPLALALGLGGALIFTASEAVFHALGIAVQFAALLFFANFALALLRLGRWAQSRQHAA